MTFSLKLRRVAAAILAAATATTMLIPLTAGSASAVPGFTFTRLAGIDRFDTARRIAVSTFGTANTVLLARADLFPDALSGSYLAGSTDSGSPILLTEVNRIPSATNEAMSTLGVDRVILLGGPAAISPSVEGELRARNLQVERIGGRDRFETSQQIAERLGSTNVGTVDGVRTAIVASGRNFPDALSGGPVSFARRLPSILTDTNTLPAPARNALTNLGIRRVFLLGGPAAVSGNVQTQIEQLGITVERFGGANRQETATLVAETAIDRLGFDDTHINLARGDFFSDALTGGPHAGDESDGGSTPGAPPAPIVLTVSPTILGAETSEFLRMHANTLRDGHIFGGQAAVSDAVEGEAARAAGAGRSIVVVDQTSVEPGGTITGNVSGDGISRVFISGCGLNERELTRDSQGDFSLTIPSGQPTGSCSLTFRVTFTDGSTETDTVSLTIDEPSRASTAAPELISVSFVRRFTQPNPSGGAYQQTVVKYTFDEAITGQAIISADSAPNSCVETTPGCSLKFKLYRFDQTSTGVGTGANPNRVYSGRNAQIDPGDSTSVLVTFGQPPATTSQVRRDLPERDFREITLAAVDVAAVRDGSNVANPYGDAPLNPVTFEAGFTLAPDLTGISNFRPSFDSTRTLVDFIFDEPAVRPIDATSGLAVAGGYWLVFNDADVSERECNFQPGPTNSTTNGNGTTTHTVSCPLVGLTQITSSSVARGFVAANTVFSTDGVSQEGATPGNPRFNESEGNPLQAHDVTGEGSTSRPDLVSVQFFNGRVNGTSATFDQALFTFDEPVLLPPTTATNPNPCQATCFAVYKSDGDEKGGFLSNDVSGRGPVRSSDNDRQIIVSYPDGTVEDATGASVAERAVLEAVGTGGVNRTNREDEVAVQGVSYAAGLTTGPDLIACEKEVTERNPISGAPTAFRLVFTFDESVRGGTPTDSGPGPDGSKFVVYDAAGLPIAPRTAQGGASTASPTRSGGSTSNEVVLSGFANQDDLRAAVACGVAEGAVFESSDDSTRAPNPIGYEPITAPQ
jgi:hypothetical protein